jgi:general secretion pathway protein F
MRFQVRALSPDNLIETHTVDAADADEAGRLLQQQRLQPLSIKAAGGVGTTGSAGWSGRSTFSLLLFSAELLALLEAGLSLVEAFEALLEKEASPVSRAVLGRLTGDLREGLRFSAALARQPDVFPPLYVGIVRAAEGTSDSAASAVALHRLPDAPGHGPQPDDQRGHLPGHPARSSVVA